MIKKLFTDPLLSFGFIALISFISLAAAFIAEGFFGLEPCNLCIYQRYPFVIGIALGLIGMGLRNKKTISCALLGALGLNFLINSGIAFHHSGVEQKWWKSALEGCAVPIFDDNNGKTLLENLMSAPMASCEDIQWQDPILGLSMANYNIALCFGLFLLCVVSAVMIIKRQKPLK